MKKVIYILCAGLILAVSACNSTPAEKAQKEADKASKEAQKEVIKAVQQETAAEESATEAIVDTVVATADELMAQVPMPELSSSTAKKYAKNIGNHIVEFINAKDDAKADSYAQKVSDELAKVSELALQGKISPTDAVSIKEYASDLLVAAGLVIL